MYARLFSRLKFDLFFFFFTSFPIVEFDCGFGYGNVDFCV